MTLEFPTVVIPPNNNGEIKAILKRLDEEDGRATPEGEPNLTRRTKLDNQRVELKALDVGYHSTIAHYGIQPVGCYVTARNDHIDRDKGTNIHVCNNVFGFGRRVKKK